MYYALLATVMYSLRAYYGKKVVNNGLSKYSMQLAMRAYGLVVLLCIVFFQRELIDFNILSVPLEGLKVLVAIIFGMSGLTLMYEVLVRSELSSFAISKSLAPAVTMILSFIFLGERLSVVSYLGIGVVVCTLLILMVIENGSIKFTRAKADYKNMLLLLCAFGLMSLSNIIYKTISNEISPLSYSLLLFTLNIIIFAVFIYFKERHNLKKILKFDKDLMILGVVATLAMFFLLSSFAVTSPTIANTIIQLQVFLFIGLGYFFLKEKEHIKLKILLGLISISGVALVTIF